MFPDIIAIIIAVLSLSVILGIIFKKFQVLSMIDTKIIPEEKEAKVKKEMLEGRLKRKLLNVLLKIKEELLPYYNKLKEKAAEGYRRVLVLEKKYKGYKKTAPKTIEDREKLYQEINAKIKEVEDLIEAGDLKGAEKVCIEIISLDQKNIQAYHLLGDIYFEMKDYEHAKEIFSFLIKFNAQDHRAYEGLGKIASSLGDLDEAKYDLIKSININNRIATYHANLAKIYELTDDIQNAIKAYQDALMLEPNNPKYLSALLKLTIEVRNKSLAVRTFDKLKKVNPENERLDELEKQVKNI